MSANADRERRHRERAQSHAAAALGHRELNEQWTRLGDHERAEFERRNARLEDEAAKLERDRADLVASRSRPFARGHGRTSV